MRRALGGHNQPGSGIQKSVTSRHYATTTKMDAAIVSVVKELEHTGISSLKDEQTIALKAFLEEKHVSGVNRTPRINGKS